MFKSPPTSKFKSQLSSLSYLFPYPTCSLPPWSSVAHCTVHYHPHVHEPWPLSLSIIASLHVYIYKMPLCLKHSLHYKLKHSSYSFSLISYLLKKVMLYCLRSIVLFYCEFYTEWVGFTYNWHSLLCFRCVFLWISFCSYFLFLSLFFSCFSLSVESKRLSFF